MAVDLGDRHHLDTPTWSMLLQVLPDFRRCTRVLLGDGATISFWFDHWIGPQPLGDMFPTLHSHIERQTSRLAGVGTGRLMHTSQRLSFAATSELQIIRQAQNNVHLDSQVADARGVGTSMLPFSSSTSYAWHMAQRSIDPFAASIDLNKHRNPKMQALLVAHSS